MGSRALLLPMFRSDSPSFNARDWMSLTGASKVTAAEGPDAGAMLSVVSRTLAEQPQCNPMLRKWDTSVNGAIAAMPADCFFIYMADGFNDVTRHMFCSAVDTIAASKTPALVIHIDSYGGNVYSLLPMLQKIESVRRSPSNPSGLPVITMCSGHVMSCGAVLWSAGDDGFRFLAENSVVMIHPVSQWGAGGRQAAPDIYANAKETERLQTHLFNFMSTHLKRDVSKWLMQSGRNSAIYITPETMSEGDAYALATTADARLPPFGTVTKNSCVPSIDFKLQCSFSLNCMMPPHEPADAPATKAVASAAAGAPIRAPSGAAPDANMRAYDPRTLLPRLAATALHATGPRLPFAPV